MNFYGVGMARTVIGKAAAKVCEELELDPTKSNRTNRLRSGPYMRLQQICGEELDNISVSELLDRLILEFIREFERR